MHVTLVEDDLSLGSAIAQSLEAMSHAVTWVRDGRTARQALRDTGTDLVLLDLGLPGHDGLELLAEARRANVGTPVLIMTARDTLQARVAGLDAGADDYLVKPFHVEELAARIRSVTRRAHGLAANRIVVGALSLDLASYQVEHHGEKLALTPREFALLRVLMERAGRIVRRESLEQSLYGLERGVESNAIEVHVHGLRRKLGPDTIRTVRGVGYMVPRDAE
ncbi:MAG TPA: response regulator [Pinirhizobacter sp.]|uniref:response regulator n=1 Tax=Pinirhizobacter sp. TaxID=2950432 RepID=UPI002C75B0CC|nr:response regulator [Pinirhizobacter sp.]HMH66807.1 response regulator [Pinirhizobacter sp.]